MAPLACCANGLLQVLVEYRPGEERLLHSDLPEPDIRDRIPVRTASVFAIAITKATQDKFPGKPEQWVE